MQTTFNREGDRKRIIDEVLAATAKRIRIVLWKDDGVVCSLEHIGEFNNDPKDLTFGCIKIAKGKKLARWALQWIEDMLTMAEKYERPLITVEQITEEGPY